MVALAVAGGGYLLHKVFRRGKRKEDDQHHDEPEPVASTSSQQSAQIEIVHERTFRHHRVVNVHLRLGAYLLLLAALVLAINKRMWDVTCALFSLGLFLLVEEVSIGGGGGEHRQRRRLSRHQEQAAMPRYARAMHAPLAIIRILIVFNASRPPCLGIAVRPCR